LAVRARPWLTYLKQSSTWTGLAIFGAASIVLILPFLFPFLAVSQDPATHAPLENVNFWSASPTDYLIPNRFHPIWGAWLEKNLIPLVALVDKESPTQADFEAGRFFANSNLDISTEFLVSPGLIALLFALYGWRWTPAKTIKPWLALTAVAVILSMGPTLHLAGRQVIIPAPQAIVDGYNDAMNYISENLSLQREPFTIGRDTGLTVPLPALLLRWFAPMLGSVRTWSRFGQFAIFGFAILAAYGAAAWYNREIARPRRQKRQTADGRPNSSHLRAPLSILHSNWPWLILIALALFELWWKPMPTHPPFTERPVDVWLRQQPGHEAIIQYPLDSSFNGVQFIYTRAHGKPIVHAYGNPFGFMLGRRHPELLIFPAPESLEQLSQWGVRYVLIETAGPGTDATPELLKQIAAVPCLHPVTVQGSIHVFELVGCGDKI
ncbi:MAG TPA: hypothetical protein VEC96_06420, partial [Anaerolineae bacterium]|nr:hypothetical protein [Anaerolineae bacterium]